jgi:hypothetical protein
MRAVRAASRHGEGVRFVLIAFAFDLDRRSV